MPDTLAQRVRAKYPGAYDDLTDQDLEAAVKTKYPGVYDDIPTTAPDFALQPENQPSRMDRVMEGVGDFVGQIGAVPFDTAFGVAEMLGSERAGEFREQMQPRGIPGILGRTVGTIAEYSIPASAIARAMGPAVSTPGVLARAAAQAGSAGAIGAANEADPSGAIVPGILAGAGTVAANAPGIVTRAIGANRGRAAANLERASQAARDVPVNVEATGQAGLRALQLQEAGGSLPRAVTQFMRRATDPQKADLTFREARDFYSNLTRLSAQDYSRLNPTMQRAVREMTSALDDALTQSAGTVGQGETYAAGMREYAKAARTEAAWEAAKPKALAVIKRAAEAAGLGGGSYAAYRAFSD